MTAIDLLGPTTGAAGVTTRPTDSRSFGAADTFFQDCSSPTNDDGTEFQAAFFNALLANIRSVVRGNGQTAGGVDVVTQDNTSDGLILAAINHLIQRAQATFAVDTGSVNNLAIALTPAPPEYKAGMVVRVKTANAPSGATQMALNALGNKPVVKSGGKALQGNEWAVGDMVDFGFDGTNWQMLGAAPGLAQSLQTFFGHSVDSIPTGNVTTYIGNIVTDGNTMGATNGGGYISVPAAGVYLLTGLGEDVVGNGMYLSIDRYTSANAFVSNLAFEGVNATANYAQSNAMCTAVASLNAGDQIKISLSQNSGPISLATQVAIVRLS